LQVIIDHVCHFSFANLMKTVPFFIVAWLIWDFCSWLKHQTVPSEPKSPRNPRKLKGIDAEACFMEWVSTKQNPAAKPQQNKTYKLLHHVTPRHSDLFKFCLTMSDRLQVASVWFLI
jgi:hypothetical protein